MKLSAKTILTMLFAMASLASVAQARPKLVVGLVVDQMRWDYLMRYQSRYVDGGFKRLLAEGYSCDNCQINYLPTITAIGHSSVYTASVPSIHGIAGNNFRMDNRWVYCTDDSTVVGVGTTSDAGKMSPRKLLVTTMCDELKLATNFRSKVIGVALKDRASILPAGHCADAAYWFDDQSEGFITSTYYMKELPSWVKQFNQKRLPRKMLSEKWETLFPVETYAQSTADDAPYDGPFLKGMPTTFPIDVPAIAKKTGVSLIRSIPAGCTLTFEMAKAALHGEKLGQRGECDFLAVSISPTDYVGHQFGINAVETEDTYLRLDRDLADFLSELDRTVGRGNYLFFLSADHGGAHNISFNQDHGIPSEPWSMGETSRALNTYLKQKYATNSKLVFKISNCQVFLDHEAISAAGIDEAQLRRDVIDFLKPDKRFAYVADMEQLATSSMPQLIRERAINGYNRFRSGDIQVVLQPACYGESRKTHITGTTHGVWNPYDAHIPCVFMGWNVPQGSTNREVHITDIAATVCAMLHVQMPNGCIGEPIEALAK